MTRSCSQSAAPLFFRRYFWVKIGRLLPRTYVNTSLGPTRQFFLQKSSPKISLKTQFGILGLKSVNCSHVRMLIRLSVLLVNFSSKNLRRKLNSVFCVKIGQLFTRTYVNTSLSLTRRFFRPKSSPKT